MVEIDGGDVRRPWQEEEAMARLRGVLAWASPRGGRRRGRRSSWTTSRSLGRPVVVRIATAHRRHLGREETERERTSERISEG